MRFLIWFVTPLITGLAFGALLWWLWSLLGDLLAATAVLVGVTT